MKVLPKHNAKKGKARPSLAVRITQWPFKLPHDKSLLFKEVKDKNTGETNVPTTFKCGKQKAVIIYIDVLDDESRRRVLTSNTYIYFICIQITVVNLFQDLHQT